LFHKPKSTNPQLQSLEGVVERVAPDIGALEPGVRVQLRSDEPFLRGYQMFRRIAAAGGLPSETVARVESDFALFASAHILNLSGMEPAAIGSQLGTERVIPWLKLKQVPEVLFENDPLRGSHSIKRVTIPSGESAEFAYVLGAHAGTRRLGTRAESIGFTSGEEKLIERVTAAAERSCGLLLGRQATVRNGLERVSATSRAHEFVGYLREVTSGNAHVPWRHLQTSGERAEFIRGFLDFSGGTLDIGHHRLIIGRRNNPGLLAEVAIVLKREGILARVSDGAIPSLHIESFHGLTTLRDRELVNAARIREPLLQTLDTPCEFQTGRPEQYAAVMAMADRLGRRGTVSCDNVRRMLQREGDPAGELSLDTIRQWVRGGHVPASVSRLRDLDALEARLFSEERLREIGGAIIKRAGSLHPYSVTKALSDFHGGAAALSRRCGVPEQLVGEIAEGKRLPSRAEYRLVLSTAAIRLEGEIERASTPPDRHIVETWLRSEGERRVFGSYQSSICLLAREAFQQGADPQHAVRDRLQHLLRRNGRMIVDDSP
jgi:hypothetical protein